MKKVNFFVYKRGNSGDVEQMSDTEFITYAQREGFVYTNEEIDHYDQDHLFSNNDIVHRAIEVSKFKVPYTMVYSGTYEVYASDIDEAIEISHELPPQEESELNLVGDSFEVDEDSDELKEIDF